MKSRFTRPILALLCTVFAGSALACDTQPSLWIDVIATDAATSLILMAKSPIGCDGLYAFSVTQKSESGQSVSRQVGALDGSKTKAQALARVVTNTGNDAIWSAQGELTLADGRIINSSVGSLSAK